MKPFHAFPHFGRRCAALSLLGASQLLAAPLPVPPSPLQAAAPVAKKSPPAAPGKPAADSARSGPSESLGLATFAGPAGWTRKAKPDFVSFESIQSAQGTWSVIGVYKNRPGSGDASRDFSAQWQEVIASKFQVSTPAEVQTSQHPSGYELKVGGAAVNSDGGPATAMLVVASGHGNIITAVFLTNTAATIPVFDRFVQGVGLNKAAAAPAPPSVGPASTAPAKTSATNGARPAEMIGIWIHTSVGGPAMYDRINGSFEGFASGSGGFLELKPNGEARMTSLLRNSGGCGMSIFTDRSGNWSANASVLTINYTSGEGEFDTCGKKSKTKAVKLGVDPIPYRLYTFEGRPAISLNAGTDAAQSFYKR